MHLLSCLAVLFLPLVPDDPKSGSTEFVAQPIDGDPVAGRLVALDDPWHATLLNAERHAFKGIDLVSLRRKEHAQPVGVSGAQVLLANGDRIRATAQHATQELIELNSEILGNLQIPLERVQAIVLQPPAELAARERFLAGILQRRDKQDTIILANGDELGGEYLNMTEMVVRIRTGGDRTVEINRGGIRAVVFSSELISFPTPKGLYGQLLLADGSEIAMLNGRLVGGRFQGLAAFEREISVPREQVNAIDFRNGRLTYLSDLEPDRFTHTPYLFTRFGYQRDRSVTGNMLSLRGQIFRKGLGVHSHSELVYSLNKPYRRLEATVGVDDETAGLGSVIFRVKLDDRIAWESPLLTGQSAPQRVQLDVTGAKNLSLIVDFATLGDVQDHADWAEARLVE